MIGTMVLVLMGCGAAVSLGCTPAGIGVPGVVGTALAFGLAVVAMAYAIGGISGCHINPAITLGVWLSGRMSGKDACMYVIFQIIGAIIGAAILFAITPGGLGENVCQEGISTGVGFVAELVFTCVFVLVVLGTTDAKKGALVHLVCIRYTGTSVNPARSIGPAIFAGGAALSQLWIFIVAPLCGAAVAAGLWKMIGCDCEK